MTKLAVVLAAAGMLLAVPALTTSASAESMAGVQLAQVSINVGGDNRRDRRRYNRNRNCDTKVIYRNGRKTVIRRCR